MRLRRQRTGLRTPGRRNSRTVRAVIHLENMFGQAVNTGIDYHVFLTPNGDCKGLYVSQKSATSFEVHELGGGTSSIAFDYRIMAKRKGFENIRMADKTAEFTTHRPIKRPAGSRAPNPDEIRQGAHAEGAGDEQEEGGHDGEDCDHVGGEEVETGDRS